MSSVRIGLVKDFEEEVNLKSVKNNLTLKEFLVKVPSDQVKYSESGIGEETKLHSIPFRNAQFLCNIKNVIAEKSHLNLYPLRNYFFAKEKAPEGDHSVFSFSVGRDHATVLLDFYLKINRELLQKLSKVFKNALLVAQVNIENDKNDLYWRLRKIYLQTNPEGVKVSELLSTHLNMTEAFIKLQFVDSLLSFNDLLPLLHILNNKLNSLKFTWKVEVLSEPIVQKCSVLLPLPGLDWEDEQTKDFAIVAANGAEIRCHREVLSDQCAIFKSMLSPKFGMLEGESGKIEMMENSEEGLYQFVKLLYGLELPLERLTADLSLELWQLSNKYGITEIEQFFKDFLGSKAGEFYSTDSLLELYFLAGSINAEELKIHSLIEMSLLSKEKIESSKYFQKLDAKFANEITAILRGWQIKEIVFKFIQNHPNGDIKKNACMKRHEFSQKTLMTVWRHLYYGEKLSLEKMKSQKAVELFDLCINYYWLPDSTRGLAKLMLQKGKEWFSPNDILHLYEILCDIYEFEDLYNHALDIMLTMHGDDLRQCDRYKNLKRKDTEKLLWTLLRKSNPEVNKITFIMERR